MLELLPIFPLLTKTTRIKSQAGSLFCYGYFGDQLASSHSFHVYGKPLTKRPGLRRFLWEEAWPLKLDFGCSFPPPGDYIESPVAFVFPLAPSCYSR